jgi:basic membrane protein A
MFALAAAACDGGGATAEETTTSVDEIASTTAPPSGEGVTVGVAYDATGRGDESFNDLAAAGLDRAERILGIEALEAEPVVEGLLDRTCVVRCDPEESLRLLAVAGADPIFAIGLSFADAVTTSASEYPDRTFAIIDSVVAAPNVVSLVFAEEQGSALVGCAAALKTTTGTVGFIGVIDFELFHKFDAGFRFGVEQCGRDIAVLPSVYLTELPDFSSIGDEAASKEAALMLFEQGADIVYQAAGLSDARSVPDGNSFGLIEAAQEFSDTSGTKVWGIGVASDLYRALPIDQREYVLTSMLKRLDVAVYSTIEAFVTGTPQSGTLVFDLAADGVGYSTSGGFVDDVAAELEDLKARIVSGELVVPTALS